MPGTLAIKGEMSTVRTSWFIAKMPSTRKKLKADKIKASVRAKVGHPFRYIKQGLGYGKVRYRGLSKNNNRLHLLASFSNLLIGDKYMLAWGQCACFPPEWQ